MNRLIRILLLLPLVLIGMVSLAQVQPRAGSLSISDASATESDGFESQYLQFTVTLSNAAPDANVVVSMFRDGGKAQPFQDFDYPPDSSILLNASQPEHVFEFRVVNDEIGEKTEKLKLKIVITAAIGGKVILGDNLGVGTILDDDTTYPLLTNGTFETSMSGWTITPATSSAKRKCGGIGHLSNCAAQFKPKQPDQSAPAIEWVANLAGIPFAVGKPVHGAIWFKVPTNGGIRVTYTIDYADVTDFIHANEYGSTSGVYHSANFWRLLTSANINAITLKIENLTPEKPKIDAVTLMFSD